MCERPILETDRLRLPVADDCAHNRERAGDRRIADTTSVPHPSPCGLGQERGAGRGRAWRRSGSPALAVTPRDAAELIGAVFLNLSDDDRAAELGYRMGLKYRGGGYGGEAGRALVGYLLERPSRSAAEAGR